MEWAASSNEVVLQHLNRLQNTIEVMLGDARDRRTCAPCSPSATAPGWTSWTTCAGSNGGKSFTWISERDGWRHLYVVSRDGTKPRLVTPGAFDLHNPTAPSASRSSSAWTRRRAGSTTRASPDNADAALPLPHPARRQGQAASGSRPRTSRATTSTTISPDGRWAFHTYSAFGTPPRDRPGPPARARGGAHAGRRTSGCETRSRGSRAAPAEFFQVDTGDGLQLDGWIMKPPDFDSTKRYPVLFHVYGEPAGQTVLDHWGGGLPLAPHARRSRATSW